MNGRYFISVLFLCLMMGLNVLSYSIDGHIPGLKDGEKVIMKIIISDAGIPPLRKDSATVKNGSFHITGVVPEGPRYYWLVFADRRPVPQYVRIFIDNDEQVIVHCKDDISKISEEEISHYVAVDGSPSNTAFNNLLNLDRLLNENMGGIRHRFMEIKETLGFDKDLVNQWMEAKNIVLRTMYGMFLENPSPDLVAAIPMIAYCNWVELSGKAKFWADVYDKLSDHLKSSYYGKLLKQQLVLMQGQSFPEFTLPTPDGNTCALKDIVARGKLTLVQFWASNSYNVANYAEELQALYKKYNEKGLNIVGISADTNINKWKGGIISLDLPWYQVSDLKGPNGVVQHVYHEYGNPSYPNTTNVLLDNKGTIVAYDRTGVELQWYLAKVLGE